MEEVACEWLQRTYSDGTVVWNDWLPHNYYAKTILWIAGIFPMSNGRNIGFSSDTLVFGKLCDHERLYWPAYYISSGSNGNEWNM